MSYILDALRKSEQQRQRGVTPRLLTVQTTPEARTQPAFFGYGSIAAALIGTGILIGWLYPRQQDGQLIPAIESIAAQSPEPRSQQSLVLPQAAREPGQERLAQILPAAVPPAPAPGAALLKQGPPLPEKTSARESPPQASSETPKETAAPRREITLVPAPEKTISAPQEKPPGTASADVPQEEHKIIMMAELPPAILKEIPAIAILVHTHSSIPKERIVGINDRLLQEGEYVAPGLKLEQIAPDGVIFSYKNYLFRHSL